MASNKQGNFSRIKKSHIKQMCLSGIFSALVFVVTAYLHVPTYNGYVHFGDGFIFLAACILPMPYSVFVGAIGAMLSDLLTGFAIWAPGSMLIKALLAMLFTYKSKRFITLRNSLMLIPAAIISTVGYYLYEALITGSFIAALSGIPASLIQALASSIVFLVAGFTLDRFDIKKDISSIYR